MTDSDYLFQSRKGNRPISWETVWTIINEAAKAYDMMDQALEDFVL